MKNVIRDGLNARVWRNAIGSRVESGGWPGAGKPDCHGQSGFPHRTV